MSTLEAKSECCDSCNYETKELEFYPFNMREDGSWLCELCAGTLAGNALEYPEQFRDRRILQTICYVGNVILAKIRKSDE